MKSYRATVLIWLNIEKKRAKLTTE